MVGLRIGWVALLLLQTPLPALAAGGPLKAGEGPGGPAAGFDRAVLQQELSRTTRELQGQSSEALRAHIRRLEELNAALELAPDVSPSERRALSEHLLARAAQIGLMLQQRATETAAPGRGRGGRAVGPGAASAIDLVGILEENSVLLVGVLGGLVIAFALGNLLGHRRGIRQASYYGEGDPRIRFLARPPTHPAQPGEPVAVTLTQIREALAAGRTVLLQVGYEIAPSSRPRFLEVTQAVRGVLSGVDGQAYTVWEDPRHPNRFYEMLVCRRIAALEQLAATDGPLSRLAEEVESCRVPGGLILRRAWWGALPDQGWATRPARVLEASVVPSGVS